MCGGPQGGGESHTGTLTGKLLSYCSADKACEGGSPVITALECDCMVCTVPCDTVAACHEQLANFSDPALNAALLQGLVCRGVPPACTTAMEQPSGTQRGVCDVTCGADEDCLVYGSGFRCAGGFCRFEEPALSPVPLICPSGMAAVHGTRDGSVEDLCVDVLEVQVSDYRACIDDAVCTATTMGNAFEDGRERYPIDWVSPDDANAYCNHVGKQLPTLAQWQWAAQNGAVFTIYPWGDTIPHSSDQPPRVCALGAVDGCAVGSFPAGNTGAGLADFAGSVAEMVQNETAICVAGGSFTLTDTDVANGAFQNGNCEPYVQPGPDVGFRCVVPAR